MCRRESFPRRRESSCHRTGYRGRLMEKRNILFFFCFSQVTLEEEVSVAETWIPAFAGMT
jgi:hypothetical protein